MWPADQQAHERHLHEMQIRSAALQTPSVKSGSAPASGPEAGADARVPDRHGRGTSI